MGNSSSSSSSCGANSGAQFGEAFGYSMANMFGFGGIIENSSPTPLDKLQQEIQEEQTKTQQLINQGSLLATQMDGQFDKAIVSEIESMQSLLEVETGYHREILREKITSNTFYIMYLFIIIIIIFIALMFVKFNN